MKALWKVADFVRTLRRRMRFGELSRAPLRLLRLELRGDSAECDWMVRPPDIWDASLRRPERERNESQQALYDAIALRDLLFFELPEVQSATLRAFRQSAAREPPELVIAGTVLRDEPTRAGALSLAMRVRLCGLQFHLNDGRLDTLQREGLR